jgi:hypothetical protein
MAVSEIICISPTAPAFEIAIGLKEDSAFITARSRPVERGVAEPHA